MRHFDIQASDINDLRKKLIQNYDGKVDFIKVNTTKGYLGTVYFASYRQGPVEWRNKDSKKYIDPDTGRLMDKWFSGGVKSSGGWKTFYAVDMTTQKRTETQAQSMDDLRKWLVKIYQGHTLVVQQLIENKTKLKFIAQFTYNDFDECYEWYTFHSSDPYENRPSIVDPKTGKLRRS